MCRNLDEKLDELSNNKPKYLIEELKTEDYINNYVHEFDLISSEKMRSYVSLVQETQEKVRTQN